MAASPSRPPEDDSTVATGRLGPRGERQMLASDMNRVRDRRLQRMGRIFLRVLSTPPRRLMIQPAGYVDRWGRRVSVVTASPLAEQRPGRWDRQTWAPCRPRGDGDRSLVRSAAPDPIPPRKSSSRSDMGACRKMVTMRGGKPGFAGGSSVLMHQPERASGRRT